MDCKALRIFVEDHPQGVVIEMIDGTRYRVPHRDFIWFTPAYGRAESRVGRLATSFWLHDGERDETRLVNAMLVKDVAPLPSNGNGHKKRSTRPRK